MCIRDSINILRELKRIDGVGLVEIMGSRDYAMRVWLNPKRLAAYNLVDVYKRQGKQDWSADVCSSDLRKDNADYGRIIVWKFVVRHNLAISIQLSLIHIFV